MNDIKDIVKGYRRLLIEMGMYFKSIKENKEYEGFADSFIDFCKSPEIGFTKGEADSLIRMSDVFCLLEPHELPSHNVMKLMANKNVDMSLLESANTLSLTDFKELIKDEETGTQDRTYRYEVVKRTVETGNIQRVYGEELSEALTKIKEEPDGVQ